MISSRAIILLSVLSVFFVSSCYEYQDACLDQLASNFNIAADSACDDCCQYPSINILYKQQIGEDLAYSKDVVLKNKFGQEYKISNAFLLLSTFEFTFQDGGKERVIEKAQFQDSDRNKEELISDALFVSVKNSSSKLGTMRRTGVIKKVESTLGIMHQLTPTDLNHVLLKNDSLYNNNMYTNFVLEVRYGDEFSDIKRLEVIGPNQLLEVSQVIDVLKEKRASISVNAIIRYDLIANELDFETADNDAFYESIKKTNWLNFK